MEYKKSAYIENRDKAAAMMGFTPCIKSDIRNTHTIYRYGCNYCAHACLIVKRDEEYKAVNINTDDVEGSRLYCPYNECPYKDELDKYRSYLEYDRHARAHWKKKIAIF